MPHHHSRWAIVLAAGEGTRLRALTTDASGTATPKQYCALRGSATLLAQAIRRAARVAPFDRVVVVVAAEHERWWRSELAHLPPENIIAQPRNRGTAPGLLLPLLTVLERSPHAAVAVLPSDHFVRDEAALAGALRRALAATDAEPDHAVLLGIAPDSPEPEYGWIVPGRACPAAPGPVAEFVEKPDRPRAATLFAQGAVWNSFLFAARAAALLALFEQRLPGLAGRLTAARGEGPAALAALYDQLSATDFSRDVLQESPAQLRVLSAPHCGWTDLGTPQRVAQCLAQLQSSSSRSSSPPRRGSRAERRRDVVQLGLAIAAIAAMVATG